MKKLTEILEEVKLKEQSSLGGGTTAGATATPGTGEQYSTKKAFKSKVPKDYKAAPSIPNRKSKAIDYKKILEAEEVLNENYARFRNETKSRKGPDQFHQAIKEAKKKVAEVNRIMEYVEKLRNELNEGEDGLKYRKHTENAISQIKESVVKLYKKIKTFN